MRSWSECELLAVCLQTFTTDHWYGSQPDMSSHVWATVHTCTAIFTGYKPNDEPTLYLLLRQNENRCELVCFSREFSPNQRGLTSDMAQTLLTSSLSPGRGKVVLFGGMEPHKEGNVIWPGERREGRREGRLTLPKCSLWFTLFRWQRWIFCVKIGFPDTNSCVIWHFLTEFTSSI